jgi:hypothetical protein
LMVSGSHPKAVWARSDCRSRFSVANTLSKPTTCNLRLAWFCDPKEARCSGWINAKIERLKDAIGNPSANPTPRAAIPAKTNREPGPIPQRNPRFFITRSFAPRTPYPPLRDARNRPIRAKKWHEASLAYGPHPVWPFSNMTRKLDDRSARSIPSNSKSSGNKSSRWTTYDLTIRAMLCAAIEVCASNREHSADAGDQTVGIAPKEEFVWRKKSTVIAPDAAPRSAVSPVASAKWAMIAASRNSDAPREKIRDRTFVRVFENRPAISGRGRRRKALRSERQALNGVSQARPLPRAACRLDAMR